MSHQPLQYAHPFLSPLRMNRFIGHSKLQADCDHKLGVLLVNLGTPDEPTPGAVRRYLAEFLSDGRVIEIPKLIWKVILHGIILRVRPGPVAKNYAKIWTDEGSPLLAISQRQAEKLRPRLLEKWGDDNVEVCVAMRYGNPSIAKGLRELHAKNVTRLLVLPMYPQYCAATTATVFDEVTRQLQRYRWIPEVRFINEYHNHPDYISALANSIRESWHNKPKHEKLLFSFHGIPKRCVRNGDPYYHQCQVTADLVAKALALTPDQWQLVFQSRFGKEEWLKPYCSDTLEEMGRAGSKSVDIACPGFSADCLETLEEIEEENRLVYTEAGGGDYHYIPALNDRGDHIDLLEKLVGQHTAGWER